MYIFILCKIKKTFWITPPILYYYFKIKNMKFFCEIILYYNILNFKKISWVSKYIDIYFILKQYCIAHFEIKKINNICWVHHHNIEFAILILDTRIEMDILYILLNITPILNCLRTACFIIKNIQPTKFI